MPSVDVRYSQETPWYLEHDGVHSEDAVGREESDVFEVLLLAGAVTMGIVGVGAALIHGLRKEAGIARRIKKSSPQTIGSFRDGTEGRIRGQASASETLRAPLSGRKCIAYELTVETKGFENDNIWGVRHRHSHAAEFTLEDESGSSASVVPEPVETWFTPDFLVNNGAERHSS